MFRRKANRTGLLRDSNPDGTRAADEGKRIIPDDLGRALQRENDGVVGVGANGAELVCDAENNSGGIRAVSEQSGIVRQDGKFMSAPRPERDFEITC